VDIAADQLFTREEALAGLPARQASTLLFLIESRTAQMAAQARRTMERFLTEDAARERDLAFFEAFSQARQPPLRPTIQDLERYAPRWSVLVPENPRLRAAIARALGRKYALAHRATPRIRAALTLDSEAVQQAYRRLYGEPLQTIYTARPALPDRLRWAAAALGRWLESLPPFWTAFALTLTETVGAGILALPIAVADLGPLAGVALLVILGLINVLTIAFMSEAIARSGTIRFGGGFIGRAVADYLGGAGSLVLTGGLFIICVVALLAYYVGFATTLADAIPLPPEVWTALLFLVSLYFLRQESLDATVASALLVGALNIGLILALCVLAAGHLDPANLLYVNLPFVGGRPFDPSILQLVFGVVLCAYFGHLSVSNCAQVVLRRDPSARSLIWGTVAAQLAAIALYCLWVLAVNGAIAPQALARQSGTALIPLAAEVGPVVRVLGSIFVILGMGMASIHSNLGIFNLVRERIPSPHAPVVTLPRRRGELILQDRRGQRLGLTYLGLAATGEATLRLDLQSGGSLHRLETTIPGRWEASESLRWGPGMAGHRLHLALEVLDADRQHVRLRVTSPLAVRYEGPWDATGLHPADLLTLPDPVRGLANWMMRQGEVGLPDVAAHLGQEEDQALSTLGTLVDEGFVVAVQGAGQPRYQLRLAPKRGRPLPQEIWQALGQDQPAAKADVPTAVSGPWLRLGKRGRFLLSVSPIVAVFLLTEWLFLTGAESFSRPLSFLGVIVVSLLGGIFPVLLLASSRRKGDLLPGRVYRLLGNPLVLTCIYLLSLSSLFLHGLVIWEGPVERAGALAVGVGMLVLTAVMARRGAFAPRLVVELRDGEGEEGEAFFSVMAGGGPAVAGVRLTYQAGEQRLQAASGAVPDFPALRQVTFDLPAGNAAELKVWAHRLTGTGDSESLPALLETRCDGDTARFDLKLSGGQVLLPLAPSGEACWLQLALERS
jgi:amino acid permease